MVGLATIQKIKNVRPIDGADKIEVCDVLGWQVVTKKGEYQPGDLCAYIQIDTVVPETEYFEFLRSKKFRVRTIKLRGALSQGLIVPAPSGNWMEGDDVTDAIGVKKYGKPDNNPGRYEKPRVPKVWHKKYLYLFKYNVLYRAFPSLLPKSRKPFPTHLVGRTDEERIQNVSHLLETCKGKLFFGTYKLDGSSITIIHSKVLGRSKFRICSRNFELFDKDNDWYRVFKSTNFERHILSIVRHYKTNDIIAQGEAIGAFNGNHHKLAVNKIALFNVYVNGKRLEPIELATVAYVFKIPVCPSYKAIVLNHTMEEILELSEVKDILNPNVWAEGIVWRSADGQVSFKAINNQYLLSEA